VVLPPKKMTTSKKLNTTLKSTFPKQISLNHKDYSEIINN